MFAKLKHLAIVSEQYTLLGRFYEGMFGMKPSQNARPFGAVVVRDGYVGLNINPRKGKAGRQAGLDHSGFEVEDVNTVYDRLRKDYPSVKVLKRPSTRPFAGISTHDPAGNVFDLSQKDMENRTDAYVDADHQQKRHVKHIALRAIEPARLAKFYRDVFELTEMEKPGDDRNFYLSDGTVVFVIMPWDITDFAGKCRRVEKRTPESEEGKGCPRAQSYWSGCRSRGRGETESICQMPAGPISHVGS